MSRATAARTVVSSSRLIGTRGVGLWLLIIFSIITLQALVICIVTARFIALR